MKMRRLGKDGPEVSAIGLGAMAMSYTYGVADETESLKTLHAAFDAGINMVDTGDFYGTGHNEMLVGRAIEGRRDKVIVAVKFGAQRDPSGAFIGYDASPKNVKVSLAYTLRRLRTDYLDLYMPARIDAVSTTSRAPSASLSWAWVRAPLSGITSSPRDRTQAMASWAVEQPLSRAMAERPSTTARFFSKFSPWKRGMWARPSAPVGRAKRSWIRPRLSTP